MNNYIKNKLSKGVLFLTGIAVFSACTDNFLKPDPLSFYELNQVWRPYWLWLTVIFALGHSTIVVVTVI